MLGEGLGVDIQNLGSTTFTRSELERGCEVDVCFYVQNADRMHGKIHIDPAVDPAPDLVIEVEITNPVLNKLPIYADFRVPDTWGYDAERLVIFHLRGTESTECSQSCAFSKASAAQLSRLVQQGMSLTRRERLRELRSWVTNSSEARGRASAVNGSARCSRVDHPRQRRKSWSSRSIARSISSWVMTNEGARVKTFL